MSPKLVLLIKAQHTLEVLGGRGERRQYLEEWKVLLAQGPEQVRREIVKRNERMTRLRISSPFATVIEFKDPTLRRRVWRLARQNLTAHA